MPSAVETAERDAFDTGYADGLDATNPSGGYGDVRLALAYQRGYILGGRELRHRIAIALSGQERL